MLDHSDNIQICWYLAAVVKVQYCRHLIDSGDRVREEELWVEINALRYAMLFSQKQLSSMPLVRQAMINYGVRSPIGSKSYVC